MWYSLQPARLETHVLGFIDDSHTAPSPTGGRFDDDWIADFGRGFERSLFALQLTWTARCDG
jgi:hypothetical protein